MKKIFLLFAAFLIFIYSRAQNTFPTSGNVGIGTINPLTILDIYNASNPATSVLRITGTAEANGNFSAILLGAGGTRGRAKGGMLFQPYGTTYGFGRLHFAVNNTPGEGDASLSDVKMTITSSGYLGLGTANPTAIMDIFNSGNPLTSLLRITGTAESKGNYTGILLGAGSSNTRAKGGMLFQPYGTSYGFGSLHFVVNNTPGESDASLSDTKMIISDNGNVGIGTSSPDQKLTVNGTIHSTQVKVDLNVPGPDYVFKKDYYLPELTDVKTYIDKNHHLAEIPSATQMAKNGVDLGEMNVKLLKKVEELTLYLLENEKRDEKSRIEIKNLKKEITKLKWLTRFKLNNKSHE